MARDIASPVHAAQYGRFVEQLEAAGMETGAGHIREMIAWTAKGNACLREALKAISNRD
jgi:hypothetical protein